jgi:hypothetical protein
MCQPDRQSWQRFLHLVHAVNNNNNMEMNKATSLVTVTERSFPEIEEKHQQFLLPLTTPTTTITTVPTFIDLASLSLKSNVKPPN